MNNIVSISHNHMNIYMTMKVVSNEFTCLAMISRQRAFMTCARHGSLTPPSEVMGFCRSGEGFSIKGAGVSFVFLAKLLHKFIYLNYSFCFISLVKLY